MKQHPNRHPRRRRRFASLLAIVAASAAALSLTALTGTAVAASTVAKTAASTANCQNEVVAAKPDGSAWTCSFDDEFSGTTLDRNTWDVQQTAVGSFTTGVQPYEACYEDDPSDVSVSAGYLHLSVRKLTTPVECIDGRQGNFSTKYTAGTVSTYSGFNQTYGRYEARVSLPNTAVAGLQETLWLWPVNDTKYGAEPASGEIDYSEFYSQYAGNDLPYLHYNPASPRNYATNSNVQGAYPAPNAEPGMDCTFTQAGFNVYTATWAPGLITIAVNGHTCMIDNYTSTAGGAAPFDQPFFLAFTQALGIGTNATTAKTPMGETRVDYVRVWK